MKKKLKKLNRAYVCYSAKGNKDQLIGNYLMYFIMTNRLASLSLLRKLWQRRVEMTGRNRDRFGHQYEPGEVCTTKSGLMIWGIVT